MKVVNLFAGPCAGKSTTAAGIFYTLKSQDRSAELITEYAKDLVYSDQVQFLQSNQEFVFAEQARRQHVLLNKVDYAITDCPLLLSHVYLKSKDGYEKQHEAFLNHVLETFNIYDNVNFFLKRREHFQDGGRIHNLYESIGIDNKIMAILNVLAIPYTVIPIDNQTVETIVNQL